MFQSLREWLKTGVQVVRPGWMKTDDAHNAETGRETAHANNDERTSAIMRSKPCRLYGWRNRSRSSDGNPHSPSNTAQQPIKAAETPALTPPGVGAFVAYTTKSKKFFAPSARPGDRYALTFNLSPHYVRQEQPARYAHPKAFATLTPPNHTTSLRSGIPLATLATMQQPPYRRRPSHTQTLQVGSQASPPLDSNQAAHADHTPTFQTHTPYFWCARPSLRSAHTSSVTHSLRSRSRHKHNRGSALLPPRGVYTLPCLYGVTLLCIGWFGFLCGFAAWFCVNNPMRSEGR